VISPRASEVEAAVAVLTATDEAGEPLYDDEKALAKALIKTIAAELEKRETYTLVPRGVPFGYGPYWSETDAHRAWKKDIGASFDDGAALVRVFPWSPKEIEQAGGTCECKHDVHMHVVKNVRGGKTGRPIECGITTCGCTNFQEAS
jgi:hypothetical protein